MVYRFDGVAKPRDHAPARLNRKLSSSKFLFRIRGRRSALPILLVSFVGKVYQGSTVGAVRLHYGYRGLYCLEDGVDLKSGCAVLHIIRVHKQEGIVGSCDRNGCSWCLVYSK